MASLLLKRKDWVDVLRGIAIIFVVFGHQARNCDWFFLYTTPIKIPLFFAISGYLFNDRKVRQKDFLLNIFRKLVIPYFSLAIIPVLVFSLKRGPSFIFDSVLNIFSGKVFWFMPCLIIAEILFFYITRLCNGIIFVSITAIIASILGIIMSHFHFLNYAMINTAFICQAYIIIGYVIKKCELKIQNMNISISLAMLILYIVLCYLSQFIFESQYFDIHLNHYYNYFYCYMLIILGCFALISLASRIKKHPKSLVFIGQNTLIIYMWVGYFISFFSLFLRKINIFAVKNTIIFSLFFTISGIFLCCMVASLVNKYLPWMVGRKRIKNE